MSCDRECFYCVNFIFKLMFNGYDGVCDKDGKMVTLTDDCDDFFPGRNKIYSEVKRSEEWVTMRI